MTTPEPATKHLYYFAFLFMLMSAVLGGLFLCYIDYLRKYLRYCYVQDVLTIAQVLKVVKYLRCIVWSDFD